MLRFVAVQYRLRISHVIFDVHYTLCILKLVDFAASERLLNVRGKGGSIYSIIYVSFHPPCWSSLTKGVLWQERNGSHMENRLLLNNPNLCPPFMKHSLKRKHLFPVFTNIRNFEGSIYWKNFVFAKMFAKIINIFAKTANVFKVPRIFAPVLHISRKLSWKNIFSRNFSWNIMSLKYFSQELSHFHMLMTSYAFLAILAKMLYWLC